MCDGVGCGCFGHPTPLAFAALRRATLPLQGRVKSAVEMATTNPGTPLLAGLRVLDMTQVLSGPYCTQILADLGAEVIKLEPPAGDLARAMQPHFIGDDSVYYVALNRNKRSIALDLRSDLGRRALELSRRLGVRAQAERGRRGQGAHLDRPVV